uniref:Uncharacterized protein n=1 Tax=Strigamia maritima TaxID=126957 RepID=T1IHL9_STRMM
MGIGKTRNETNAYSIRKGQNSLPDKVERETIFLFRRIIPHRKLRASEQEITDSKEKFNILRLSWTRKRDNTLKP